MRKSILNSILAAVLIILVSGCASKKKLPAKETVEVEDVKATRAETIAAINASRLNFETFAVRAKADLAIGNNKNDVTMHIRIRKDEAIWISVTAIAGLEVGRALITPDSIRIINRIESVYIKKPFSYVHQFANKQINYKTLESIFTGNVIPELLTDEAEISTNPGLRITGNSGDLAWLMLFMDNKKVSQLHLKDTEADQELKVNYSDFVAVNGMQVPQMVSINSEAVKKNVGLELKYNKIDIDAPMEMPFNVSKRFTVKD